MKGDMISRRFLRQGQSLRRYAPQLCMTVTLFLWGCGGSGALQARSRVGTLQPSPHSAGVARSLTAYVITPGDRVDISVWGYSEFNTETSVGENGMVKMPLVGEIPAAGFTQDHLEEQIRHSLAEYIDGDIKLTTSIVNPKNEKVAVLGAVTRQDNYDVTTEVSLVSILSTAGGATDNSDLHHVKIIRAGQSARPLVIDLAAYIQEGNTHLIPPVRPGDTVFVPVKKSRGGLVLGIMRDTVILLTLTLTLYRIF